MLYKKGLHIIYAKIFKNIPTWSIWIYVILFLSYGGYSISTKGWLSGLITLISLLVFAFTISLIFAINGFLIGASDVADIWSKSTYEIQDKLLSMVETSNEYQTKLQSMVETSSEYQTEMQSMVETSSEYQTEMQDGVVISTPEQIRQIFNELFEERLPPELNNLAKDVLGLNRLGIAKNIEGYQEKMDRDKKMLESWNSGYTAEEIGKELHLSPGTVRNRITQLRKDLGEEKVKYH